MRFSLQCKWPLAGFCTAGTLTCLQFCHLPPMPPGWSLPAIPHDTPVAGLNVPGEGLMCLRIPTELPSCLHGTKVCVGRFKGQGCLSIASGTPTSVLRHLRQGHCVLSLSFLIWRMGRAPRAQTVKGFWLFCLHNGPLADTGFPLGFSTLLCCQNVDNQKV